MSGADNESGKSPEVLLEKLLKAKWQEFVARAAGKMSVGLTAAMPPEDIVQMAAARAFQAIGSVPGFEPRDNPVAGIERWFRRIIDHVILEEATRRGRRKQSQFESKLHDTLVAKGSTASRKLGTKEALQLLRTALKKTPAIEQQVLQLRYGEELSIAAIAERIGRSQEAIKQLLQRARRRLKTALGRSSRFHFRSRKRRRKGNDDGKPAG